MFPFPVASPVISHRLTFCDSDQMRTSIAPSRSERRASQRRRITTPHRQCGLEPEELDRNTFKARAIDSPSDVSSLQEQAEPAISPSVTPITGVNGPLVHFSDNNNTTCGVNLGTVERTAISGSPETAEAEDRPIPVLARTEGAIGASRESVDNVGIEAHGDENGPR